MCSGLYLKYVLAFHLSLEGEARDGQRSDPRLVYCNLPRAVLGEWLDYDRNTPYSSYDIEKNVGRVPSRIGRSLVVFRLIGLQCLFSLLAWRLSSGFPGLVQSSWILFGRVTNEVDIQRPSLYGS